MAWTVTPTADADGNVSGFNTDHAHEGYWKDGARDYVEDPITNQISHVMQDVELNEDASEEMSDDGYFEALASLYDSNALNSAINWAAGGGLPPDWIQEYNQSLESGDYTAVAEKLDTLMGQYETAHPDRSVEPKQEYQDSEETEDSELMTYEDLSDSDREQVDNAVEELQYSTPQGEDYAAQWDQVVDAAQAAGDDTYALVAAATAAYHAGEMGADEAIQYCLESADIRELSRVWNYINQ